MGGEWGQMLPERFITFLGERGGHSLTPQGRNGQDKFGKTKKRQREAEKKRIKKGGAVQEKALFQGFG